MILFAASSSNEGFVRVSECSESRTAFLGSMRKCFAATFACQCLIREDYIWRHT